MLHCYFMFHIFRHNLSSVVDLARLGFRRAMIEWVHRKSRRLINVLDWLKTLDGVKLAVVGVMREVCWHLIWLNTVLAILLLRLFWIVADNTASYPLMRQTSLNSGRKFLRFLDLILLVLNSISASDWQDRFVNQDGPKPLRLLQGKGRRLLWQRLTVCCSLCWGRLLVHRVRPSWCIYDDLLGSVIVQTHGSELSAESFHLCWEISAWIHLDALFVALNHFVFLFRLLRFDEHRLLQSNFFNLHLALLKFIFPLWAHLFFNPGWLFNLKNISYNYAVVVETGGELGQRRTRLLWLVDVYLPLNKPQLGQCPVMLAESCGCQGLRLFGIYSFFAIKSIKNRRVAEFWILFSREVFYWV